MDSVTEPSIEFTWKLNSGRWNPLASTAVVPFVMLIRTILIPNLDCLMAKGIRCLLDGVLTSLSDSVNHVTFLFSEWRIAGGCDPVLLMANRRAIFHNLTLFRDSSSNIILRDFGSVGLQTCIRDFDFGEHSLK